MIYTVINTNFLPIFAQKLVSLLYKTGISHLTQLEQAKLKPKDRNKMTDVKIPMRGLLFSSRNYFL